MPKTASAPAKRRAPSKRAPGRRAPKNRAVALPAWADLAPPSKAGAGTRKKAGAKPASKRAAAQRASKARVERARPLDVVPSLRFGVTALVACVLIVLFLGHAYATRATLDALQDARRENERLRLTHQRLRGDVDRMTGPSAVLGRAAALGLEEGVAYGPTIRLDD